MVLFYRAHWRDYKNDQVRIMMNLTTLTHRDALCLNARFTSREEAIHALTQRLAALGKISSTEQFLEEVYRRESLGPTALGEGLAVPHGKTAAVKEAAFAVATLSEPLQWEGVDGPEAVDLVVLLAIPPNEAGTTHMQLLTALTTRLADDEIRARIQSATTPDELLSALDDKGDTQPSASFSNAPTIVCVTACPAGIAHTYMAAEYLEKAGRKLGVNVYVEKQGANGIEGRLTADQLNSATACIFAAEVAIKESERFNGIPALSVRVAEPIRHAEALMQQALTLKRSDETRTVQQDTQPVKSVKTELKQALLSGISFAVPLIVAGGTVLAVAVLLSQIFGLQDLFNEENSWLWMYRKLGGGLLGILMVPVLAAYTAYSLADKPALAPGFAAGLAANMIGSGFLGAVVGGLIAGYLMRWVKNHLRLSSKFNGFLTFYLYPVLGTLGAGSLMLFVVGEPVAWINNSLTAWLNGLSGSNALLLGAILGFMCSFDLGGPVNKAAYAFCLGAMANGVYGPYAIFASVKMVSAFTVTASTMLAPRLFKEFEIETGKSTWLLGLAGITEGAIPMAIEDPLRVIGSFVLGSMVTGAIVGAMNIGLSTPGAGIFSLFLLHDNGAGGVMAAIGWFGAALVGAAISTAILLIWRRHAVKHGNYLTDGVMP
ncbi:PTS 2-O-a-mannosyl-D-glycerate transporter subunit IIABC [Escherichia coli]|jgi:2-O-A-mannosyl-D-glycerate-specific PTS system IIC component|uniref:PTS 2-O-a-mannosyl-D-glycerate transporter subunit IIABC n=35 Tax=Enterobacterales TaxID=91347 RepID=A0A1U9SM20_ECOLX|nr:PTS system 2-O-a-mannosyl-D-glycerate specific transporter subunit IIABC [Escherichia coli O104:H4 str. 2009EL-2050]AFS75471.1 PTS system 2-O-a-mannosyl-D-glycerate specific transporter subunit IIABC [Escherichia coli O104:H4 str. 2011C-3493]AFS85227.1 PTS system 2-O-a-mannosyl-D-glycerate specific transporter subunit IIABC [Escherichia coli O104:H4 str. 2009EL-2071]AQV21465.1 PTS 2-O-a-mannosyl-D-glycerate transporter subunit IIABC [Escherichia coli]ATG61147.1 PTS 2-O-a-mannosyl-D-glycerate